MRRGVPLELLAQYEAHVAVPVLDDWEAYVRRVGSILLGSPADCIDRSPRPDPRRPGGCRPGGLRANEIAFPRSTACLPADACFDSPASTVRASKVARSPVEIHRWAGLSSRRLSSACDHFPHAASRRRSQSMPIAFREAFPTSQFVYE